MSDKNDICATFNDSNLNLNCAQQQISQPQVSRDQHQQSNNNQFEIAGHTTHIYFSNKGIGNDTAQVFPPKIPLRRLSPRVEKTGRKPLSIDWTTRLNTSPTISSSCSNRLTPAPYTPSKVSKVSHNLIENTMMMLIKPTTVGLITNDSSSKVLGELPTCASISTTATNINPFDVNKISSPMLIEQRQQKGLELELSKVKIDKMLTTVAFATTTFTTTASTQAQSQQEQIQSAESVTESFNLRQSRTECSASLPHCQSLSRCSTSSTIDEAVFVHSKSKQKSTITNENKCASKELTNVSNEREFEANSPLIATISLATTSCEIIESHELELDTEEKFKNSHIIELSSRSDKIPQIGLTLAERKAKLKRDFLKETKPSQKQTLSTFNETTSQTDTSRQSNLMHHINRENAKPVPDSNFSDTRITKDTSSISVLPTVTLSSEERVENISRSFVAQRKLDLKRKFEEQFNTKSLESVDVGATQNLVVSSRIDQLLEKFDSSPRRRPKMIVNSNKLNETNSNVLTLKGNIPEQRNSPLSDEGCNLGHSPYSSDDDDNESIRTTIERSKRKDKVARSASSDSALGLEVDDALDGAAGTTDAPSGTQQRRMTLTVADIPLRPALLPLAEPTALPDSPTPDLQQTISTLLNQTVIPSKVLLEERVVEIPDDPRSVGCSLSSSRRESAQSCISDYQNSECGGVRYVRTPSVVVSDYSDDVMCGLTLEEIEYFRAHRMRRRRSSVDTANTERDCDGHSDVSAASSCSNLYYCGSTISALDGAECYVNGVRMPLERKVSDCSTCSASAGEDDEQFIIREQAEEPQLHHVRLELKEQDALAELMAAQHLTAATAAAAAKRITKKVGLLSVPDEMGENRFN